MRIEVAPGDQQEDGRCANVNVETGGGPLPAPDMVAGCFGVGGRDVPTRRIATGSRAASSALPFLQPQKLRSPVTAHAPAQSHPTPHGMGGSICGLIGLREMGSSSIRPATGIGGESMHHVAP